MVKWRPFCPGVDELIQCDHDNDGKNLLLFMYICLFPSMSLSVCTSVCLSPSLSYLVCLCLSVCLSHSLTHSLTHSHSLTLIHHSLTHFHSLTLTHSPLTHTHSPLTHSLTHSLTHMTVYPWYCLTPDTTSIYILQTLHPDSTYLPASCKSTVNPHQGSRRQFIGSNFGFPVAVTI